MSDKNYFHQGAKSLIFHVENGLKMQYYSKDSDNYEFLLCFLLKFTIKYSDFLYRYINYQQIINHKITIPKFA